MKDVLSKLTRDDIMKAAKKFADFRPAKWTVLISGVEYPVRPLVREATGVNPMDAPNSHQSVTKLRSLGFDTRYEGKSV